MMMGTIAAYKQTHNPSRLARFDGWHWSRIRFAASGFRFIVNPDLDSLANLMVSIRGCCRKRHHCYSFASLIPMSLPVSLANPRQNWIRKSGFGFAHWMDGFNESGKSEIWIRIRQKSNTAGVCTHRINQRVSQWLSYPVNHCHTQLITVIPS